VRYSESEEAMIIEICERKPNAHPHCARLHRTFQTTRNEEFWLEVIRQASGDEDPGPSLKTVRQVRAIFHAAHDGSWVP
jgi:hypothetical protein